MQQIRVHLRLSAVPLFLTHSNQRIFFRIFIKVLDVTGSSCELISALQSVLGVEASVNFHLLMRIYIIQANHDAMGIKG